MLIGIVGKPNSGKSTFFKALTLAEVEIANFPFTTIKPNEGIAFVKIKCIDKEFNKQCQPRSGSCQKGYRFVPVKVIDVAGLVPGAHEGKGLGNQFLDDLRQSDLFIHIVDVSGSTNEKGEPIEPGTYDPAKDIRFLEIELDMWYLQILKKGWEKFARTIIQEKQEIKAALAKQLSGLKVTEEIIDEALKKLDLNKKAPNLWGGEELGKLATELRKITKPMLIACNKIDVEGALESFAFLKEEFPDYLLLPCSAESELALREAAKAGLISYIPGDKEFKILDEKKLSEKQKKALKFIQEKLLDELKTTGLQEVLNQAVFNFLRYIAVFPVENSRLTDKDNHILPDCFLMPPGSTALDLAYQVHTALGKSFIRAIDLKTKKPVGKTYLLNHRDVLEIVTGKHTPQT